MTASADKGIAAPPDEDLPVGVKLLDHLYCLLQQGLARDVPILQRLFHSALIPFTARVQDWLNSEDDSAAVSHLKPPTNLSLS